MNLVDASVETLDSALQADARYRALVDVASVLASHAELPDLLRSLRGQLETLLPFRFLAVGLREGDSGPIVLRHI